MQWPKKLVPRLPHHEKFRVQSSLGKWKTSEKLFGLKFGMTQKKLGPGQPPPEKFRVQSALVKEKSSEIFFNLKFDVTKTTWCPNTTSKKKN